MMLSSMLQIIILLVPTLALGGPTEVPDKCSTSSPNYCACRENDTLLLKPVALCLSPTDQNDHIMDCFPCFVSDQDLLSCASLKEEYPVCPLQQFQSGESRSQLYIRANYTISKPNFTMSISEPMKETFQDLRYNGEFKKKSRYRSTSLPYEFNYVSKHPKGNFSNIFKDIHQSKNGHLKNETISKIGISLLFNETNADEAIASIKINESDVRSRSRRSTFPHNNWCCISRIRRNGNLHCTFWTYKKECVVSCHKGYEIDGKPSLNMSCDRKYNKWEPNSISQACKESDELPKEIPQQQIYDKPGSSGGAEVFIREYEPDFGKEDYLGNNHFYFGGELTTNVGQLENGEFFDDPKEGFLSAYGQLNDYAKNLEGQMNNLGDIEQARYPDYDLRDFGYKELGEAEHDTKK